MASSDLSKLTELTTAHGPVEENRHIVKIRCDGQRGGRICDRWLARIEDGALYIACPRCKGEKRIELAELFRFYRDWLARSGEDLQDIAFQMDLES